jgi:hypothetical protein
VICALNYFQTICIRENLSDDGNNGYGKETMPEWLLIVLAIAGIFILGLFFAILGFFKDLARLLFLGVFVFLLILIGNRIFPAIESSRLPDGSFRLPRVDPDSELSESLREFGRDLDEFVFGPESTDPEAAARSRDLIYPLPDSAAPSTIAEQPVAPSQPAVTVQPSQPSRSINDSRDPNPLPALW